MNIVDRFVQFASLLKRRFAPLSYDAATHDAESYYASQYLVRIEHHLSMLKVQPLHLLEAGCGSGRFLIPLAERGHHTTGVDYHLDSVRLVREKVASIDNGTDIKIHDGDLDAVLPELPTESFDAILCLEVLYTSRNRRKSTEHLYRLIKPGGLFFITHKPRSYFLWQSLKNGHFDDALHILNNPEGRLRKGNHRIFYNWQSLQEIDDIYTSIGATILARYPVGPYSGFSVDPLTDICDPGKLNASQLKQLARLESGAPQEMLAASRYVLVVGKKPI